jgi:hypothetical protein
MKTRTEKSIESMKSMMQSMYCYHQLDREGYFFDSHLKIYEEYLGKKLFDEVYNEYHRYLKNNYKIVNDVYTDHEGCTYNSLVKINEDGE